LAEALSIDYEIAGAVAWLKNQPGAPPIKRLAYLVTKEEWDHLVELCQTYAPQFYPEQRSVTQIRIAGMKVRLGY
jgi:hypothetical protein